jgi:hypothetical protein
VIDNTHHSSTVNEGKKGSLEDKEKDKNKNKGKDRDEKAKTKDNR